ncbi:hypothetical protein Rsub_01471 [Raphidocelis subcapitata]|uniref:Uncharacterized protein n=1 Tax=Raphidocelis subcapitata TaxID=307507 RepID=A0A2V0NQS8_9CHLO|nr:hypothetical protein Rsub_01471 [Raphidocelis subcapitata]|eukprot:GBF88972.1 hypothetical protein Rsub_01471 [Raphidocelis subcapitata]
MAATERLIVRARAGRCTLQAHWPAQRLRAAAPRPPARRHAAVAVAASALPPPASLRLMASPFDALDGQLSAFDRQFDRQFAQMDADMDAAFRRMDRVMDESFRDMQRMQRDLDAELARGARELSQQQPGVRIERSEQRGVGSYRFYESIEIRSGPLTALVPAPAHAPAAPLFSPLLVAALALGAAWAGVTALFARNYGLTLFSERSKARLLATWPYLAAFSGRFREQFVSALRGRRVKAAESAGGGGGGGGGASGGPSD